ncbi:AP-3 complex subunit beta-1-like isoform X2 [Clytia hemisphaerica]|uniref:AP-3 complex subunit beta-1-like isoform X2 n=1 Tax=Clytia hemisphaerica TaxID=252671 RepID=UPI0034D6A325
MLDSSKDSQKLDAMKKIVGTMASGKDVSDMFPGVVKNVVSKNIEIKKLVYVYLVRYAEEQQDLALLSIATFQRGLKDPNQLIRASALRVLSSIRVPMIVPIMMLSLKEAVSDMSPYVRKTAANAIPKLYSLDPEQKDALVEIIEKLLQDKTTLVAGSTVIAFEEVCPERIDLVHKNYRKLCNMLIDIDEWGQVAVINMLVRYARTQFLNPNKNLQEAGKEKENFYPSSESEKSDEEDSEDEEVKKAKQYIMDADHRLLLRSCQPLLQSRNSAVVMAVAKVYHHVAPKNEIGVCVRALVRLLRSHLEVQTIVLSNIVTMSLQHKGLFDQYMKSFFVHSGDSKPVKKLKLEILTNLATESNIPTVLREFQTYVASIDKEFAALTIQAIGRCASNIPEVADTCLAGLIRMLSNRDETVVSECIIVIKKLLQMGQKGHNDVITHMAKLLDKVKVPMARASILWLIGEYSERIPKVAPDVLRKMAKTFATEDDLVKLQIINLGAKLYVTNSKQTRTLYQYVLQLAKYDQNFDIRDRARFLRFLLFPTEKSEGGANLKKKAKKIFLAEKPAPVLESLFKDRSAYQLGSLSHMIDAKAAGYQELPEFPDQQPDPSVRNVEVQPVWGNQFLLNKEGKGGVEGGKSKKDKGFYSSSEEEESGSDEDDSDEESEESGEEESSEEEEEAKVEADEEEEESEEESEDDGEDSEFDELSESEKASSDEEEEEKEQKAVAVESEESEEESSEEESEEESSEEESSEEEEVVKKPPPSKGKKKNEKKSQPPPHSQSGYDQLLDLDDFTSPAPATNGGNDVLTPSLASDMNSLSLDPSGYSNIASYNASTPGNTKTYELLNKINGKGLVVNYRYTRGPCIYSRNMVAIELELKNQSGNEIKKIHVGNKKLSSGSEMHEFTEIESLAAGQTIATAIGVDFKDTMQPAKFDICTENNKFSVTVNIPVGELMRGTNLIENEFTTQQKKLTGMNESSTTCTVSAAVSADDNLIAKRILESASLTRSPSPAVTEGKITRYSGVLISSSLPVLVSVHLKADKATITINCEKISVGSNLMREMKTILSK